MLRLDGHNVLKSLILYLVLLCMDLTVCSSTKEDLVEYSPPEYPTNLLQNDWSQRKLKCSPAEQQFYGKIYDLEVYRDDVWLVTLPKAGTTWMQELLWLVMNEFDFEKAKKEHLELRSPFLEFDYYISNDVTTCFQRVEQLKRPRLVKTHLSLPFLPHQVWHKKPKVIYVVRNLKDVIVSGYYHTRAIGMTSEDTTLDHFVIEMMEDNKSEEDFFPHIMEFYALRNQSWVFYTSFERMKSNLREVITDVCQFLNKTIDEKTMAKMLKHLSFEEMKTNPKTHHVWEFEQIQKTFNGSKTTDLNFIRKGKVNGYREELTEETIKRLDKWMDEHLESYNVTFNELLLLSGNSIS
ncbi:estrogen sulfotransferase Ste2-like [Stomoxys calcitrans]|uniref:estrogen sulfotransferase Ste2-like n=1 Tax=Stomoxys calcitrans TaxID=35570 RepID=UPI0027E2B4F6|nr:estrogen sulfotransferase Ste2-like [Stomoxys calcitrans]